MCGRGFADSDVLSMELDYAFRDCYLNGDHTVSGDGV